MKNKFFKFENGMVYNVDYIVYAKKYTTESIFTFKEDNGTYTLIMTLQDYDNFVVQFTI